MIHKHFLTPTLFFVLFTLAPGKLFGICQKWSSPQPVVTLPQVELREVSALSVSVQHSQRFYFLNDSGFDPVVHSHDEIGGWSSFEIENFKGKDIEDLDLKPCHFKKGACLFVADIGDNKTKRSHVEVAVISEKNTFKKSEKPVKTIKIQFPNSAYDAESLTVHPSTGDLFILTKNYSFDDWKSFPNTLFRVPFKKWIQKSKSPVVAEKVQEFNLEDLAPGEEFFAHIPTSMALSPDGESLIVLTYLNAFEFPVTSSKTLIGPTNSMIPGVDFKIVVLTPLEQQEAISYGAQKTSVYYTSESVDEPQPLMKLDCQDFL